MTRHQPTLSWGAHISAILRLGLPLIGSHLAQIAIGITDTVMLGWYSVDALAAGALGSTSFFLLFLMGSGFAFAVMPLVAAAAAAGDTATARRTARMGLWASILFALVMLPVVWFATPILRALGQDPRISEMAGSYLQIVGLGLMPALMVMVLKGFLAALERTQIVLWATLAGAALNAALDWALIFGHWGAPEMGLRGAAIASVIGQMFALVLLATHVAYQRQLREYDLFRRLWRPDIEALTGVVRLGWPIGLTNLAESGLFTASALMMGWLGTYPLAAHGIAIQIVAVTFMVHVGLSNAATVRAGQALGRGDPAGLRRGAWAALALSGLFATVAVGVFLTEPAALIGLFLSANEPARPEIIRIGTGLLAIAALFQLADASQVMAIGLLRGLQDTRVPMVIAALSYWGVGIPVSYLLGLPLGLGGQGIWLGLVLGLALAATLLMLRFWHRARALVPAKVSLAAAVVAGARKQGAPPSCAPEPRADRTSPEAGCR